MNIPAINSSQSISHKAYFKPNKAFKSFFGAQDSISDSLMQSFSKLPNHELEIINAENHVYERMFNVLQVSVFNNMTNKIIEKDFHFATFKIEHLIKFLCQKNPKIQNFFEIDVARNEQFNKLITPNR